MARRKLSEFEKLVNRKKRLVTTLKKDIQESLSVSEQIYFELSEKIDEKRKEDPTEKLSSTSSEIESILDNIILTSRDADLGELKAQLNRLKALKSVFDKVKKTVSSEESKRLAKQFQLTEKSLEDVRAQKSTFLERSKGFLKSSGVDVGSIFVGAAGRDPIGMFMAKILGDRLQQTLETKLGRKGQVTKDKESLYQAMKASPVQPEKVKGPTRIRENELSVQSGITSSSEVVGHLKNIDEAVTEIFAATDYLKEIDDTTKETYIATDDIRKAFIENNHNVNKISSKNINQAERIHEGQDSESYLKSIDETVLETFIATDDIKKDIQRLVKSEEERLKLQEEQSLNQVELSLESERRKKNGILESINDGKDKNKGVIANTSSSLLSSLGQGLEEGVGFFAVSKLTKIATSIVTAVAGSSIITTIMSALTTIAIPAILGVLAAGAGYAVGTAIYKIAKGLLSDPELNPQQKKEAREKAFINKTEELQQKKEELQKYKDSANTWWGPNKDSAIFKESVKRKEEDIQDLEKEVLTLIRDEHKHTTPEKITELFNKTTKVSGEKPSTVADLGLISTPAIDARMQAAKEGKARERLKTKGYGDEDIDAILRNTSKAGESNFSVPQSIQNKYISQMQKEPQRLQEDITQQERPITKNMKTDSNGLSDKMNWQTYAENVSGTESGGNYKIQEKHGLGYLGKYQMGAGALADAGLVKKGTTQAGLDDDGNWNIEGGKKTFLNSPDLQEQAFQKFTESNYKQLIRSGALDENSTPSEVAGALKAAHLAGAGGASQFINSGGKYNPSDVNKTSASQYYAQAYKAQEKAQIDQQDDSQVAKGPLPQEPTNDNIRLSSLSSELTSNEASSMNQSSGTTIINANSGGGAVAQQPMKGAHGPVGTRQSDPILFELQAKQMKTSVC